MSESDFRNRLDEVGRELDQATVRWTATRRRRNRVLVIAAAALIAGGSAVAISTEIGSHGTELAAAQVLERAAQAESSRAKARESRYFYTETRISTRTRTGAPGREQTVTSTQTTELWAGKDGSGVQVAHPEQVQAPPARETPAAGATGTTGTAGAPPPVPAPAVGAPDRASRPDVSRYGKGTIGRGELGSFDTAFRDSMLRSFGLDARRLVRLAASQSAFNDHMRAGAERVVQRLRPSGARRQAIDSQAFFLVAGLLGRWGEPLPDRLRGALFRFAATLDGIAVDESFTDDRGRRGIALSFGSARIVLAPGTYGLRATTYTTGNVETTIETVRTAVVDRAREHPAG